jgi:hypothetical protein
MSTAETRFRSIHYFYYTEYDALAKLGFELTSPKKVGKTYIAMMQRPIYFTLPKSEIIEIYECNYTGQNRLKYVVESERYSDLVDFLDNLDSHCIELSYQNSQEWFRRKASRELLVDQYCNLYDRDKDEDNKPIFEAVIEKDKLIDTLMDYNRSSSMNLMVCIKGIEFFKDKFQWYITLEKVVYLPSEDVARVDKSKEHNRRKMETVEEEHEYNASDYDSDEDDDDDYSEDESDDLSDESEGDDYESADRQRQNHSTANVSKVTKSETTNKKVDTPNSELQELQELQERIRQYSEESKRLFLTAERSRKASDMYYQRATYLQNQVRKYEEQLRSGNK